MERQLRHELELIAKLRYAPYFLTVHDIVAYARSRDILCQGRGSAANSAVCYVLGVTAVDPARVDLLFERFVSAQRDEPPDIDVDFEHERREEVIQWIYGTYGRDHAALAATVIRYRAKSAMREVAKVMGLTADVQEALSRTVWGYGSEGLDRPALREAGLDAADPTLRRTLDLARELMGFPRHLSQHVGGFVIAKSPLRELVPIENAAMPDRTVVEWDKDDLDALKMLKIDVLALGMLTCIRKGFELLRAHHGIAFELATIPAEDAAVYEMLCRADSIGVFQVESRAQMSMLPRLKPRTFYDLVIEVAIVRPGPIQGDMVHPYLRRRDGIEPVEFPSDELRAVLGKTMGVPLFQEQAMKIAIVAAGFTPAEADGLRRSMAAFRRSGPDRAASARSWSRAWWRAATTASSPRPASGRSRASAITASPRATPPASRSWSTSRPGSSATIPTCSAPPSSTPSRWASTPRPSSCATRSTTASRSARSTSTTATGTPRSSRASAAGR